MRPTTSAPDPRPAARRRSRARVIVGAVLRVLGFLAVLSLVGALVGSGLPRLGVPPLLASVVAAVLLLSAYAGLVWLVEKRRPAEITPRRAAPELLLGCLIGAGLFTTTVGIIWLLGFYHVDGTNPVAVIWASFGAAVLAGVFEELILRGVLFRILEESLGSWLALALSAAVFGALHLANPGATLVGTAAIALEAGVLLGAAYLATRRLWLPIGLHLAWNATQSAIFGVPTSGITMDGLLRSHLTGPTLISGGEFGVEGSIVTVVMCLIAAAAMLAWARRHNRIVRPSWRRARGDGDGASLAPAPR